MNFTGLAAALLFVVGLGFALVNYGSAPEVIFGCILMAVSVAIKTI
jgi:hypothetical protein